MNPGYTNVANCEKVDDSKYSNFLQMQASRKPTYNYMKPKRPIPTEKTRKKYEDAIEHDTLDELMDDDGNDHLRQNDSPDAYMTEGDDADDPDDSPRYNDDDYHSTTGDDDSYEDSEDLNSNMLFNENYDGGDNNVDDKSNEFNAYEENNNGLMDDSPQENEYESENGYNEINDTDDYDDVIEEEEEETGEDIGDVLSPNGLEYLGAGYDLLKGNPLGDTVILLDPGYRASIIQMHWRNDGEGFSNSREYIQPKGAWVRPYISCHKGETISDVGKSQSFTDVLSVDAEVSASFPGDALKFAASLNYNNIKKSQEMKDVKTYVSRSYCFNYVAGIPMSIKWDFTAAFDVALRTLSKNFEEEARGMRCTTRDYRANPTGKDCVELGVSAWMRLFTIFGTHVTSKVYLGGKMLTIMETKASQEADLAKRGIDIQAELSVQAQAAMVDTSVSASTSKSLVTSKESLDTRNSMFVMGGNIYGNGQSLMFNDWAATVSKFSMPIKAEYTPIAMFLDPEYMEAYNDAYLFYGKVLLGDDAIPK
ncbi:uncharacterized protein BXIN_1761 [Babesia sp. Xinjiang]|uniref:uncharacterized protein n=1 Tax=Babesia sp. Xinjiang TaxID=462227 RepID=UPI000A23AB6F|nr:uncharacterized protein BXIN_1658 [Babesia sp. Xinjiang]XP_028871480.1 uncharacterized protein BXIN_1761 [Babesia sp. Xinjiang]ORM40882.1 hypothetical protein BXIN_1658 [Babesia sp. Xinjiang]ORM41024.1 hypothetical protein BXIN_1761 [Babesia sp. Xinjiang]